MNADSSFLTLAITPAQLKILILMRQYCISEQQALLWNSSVLFRKLKAAFMQVLLIKKLFLQMKTKRKKKLHKGLSIEKV